MNGTPWAPEQIAFAAACVGRPGWSYERLAWKLGRSPDAVKLRLKRSKVRAPIVRFTQETLTLRDVIEVLGLAGNHRPVRRWINDKLLKARKAPWSGDQSRVPWVIYAADLAAFLQAHPGRYEAHRLPETWKGKANPFLRCAVKRDPADGALSMKQAAVWLGVSGGTLKRWRREGRIAAEKRTGASIHEQEWFFTRATLAEAKARLRRLKNGRFSLPPVPAGQTGNEHR